MIAHLPALQVVIPLLAAPLLVLLRHRGVVWGVAVLVSWVSLAISILLLQQVAADGVISYLMGGWAVPWGI